VDIFRVSIGLFRGRRGYHWTATPLMSRSQTCWLLRITQTQSVFVCVYLWLLSLAIHVECGPLAERVLFAL